jgi:hypothetical protein
MDESRAAARARAFGSMLPVPAVVALAAASAW